MKTCYVIAIINDYHYRMFFSKSTRKKEILNTINYARVFETLDEAYEVAKKNFSDKGFYIMPIEEGTINKIKEKCHQGDYSLYNKFHNPMYGTIELLV